MPEVRNDPIVDRRVIIAESRAGRPGAFYETHHAPKGRRSGWLAAAAASCPFCAGNESQTPPAVYERTDEQNQWLVRIVPNKYPAVVPNPGPSRGGGRLPAIGVHEVVIESPQHAINIEELPSAQLSRVLTAWRDRIAEHRAAGKWKSVLLFKNSGIAAGASLEHVHSQVIALLRVPQLLQQELEAVAASYRLHRACAFCRLIESERRAASRVLIDRRAFIAVAAVAGRQPYETWILPAEHQAAYDLQTAKEIEGLAAMLAQVLQALRTALQNAAYNLILHTAPFDTDWGDRYHWHIEIIPRISGVAGFELGAGEFINPISPERAAGELKGILAASGEL